MINGVEQDERIMRTQAENLYRQAVRNLGLSPTEEEREEAIEMILEQLKAELDG